MTEKSKREKLYEVAQQLFIIQYVKYFDAKSPSGMAEEAIQDAEIFIEKLTKEEDDLHRN